LIEYLLVLYIVRLLWHGFINVYIHKLFEMKTIKQFLKPFVAAASISLVLGACTATVKVPKHPGPGEPPPPPKVEINR